MLTRNAYSGRFPIAIRLHKYYTTKRLLCEVFLENLNLETLFSLVRSLVDNFEKKWMEKPKKSPLIARGLLGFALQQYVPYGGLLHCYFVV